MLLKALNPTESLEKTYRLQAGNREQIDRFKTNFTKLLSLINERESEENVKDHLMDFLKEVYYKDAHVVAPKGKTDFVIHLGKDATTQAGVLFEVKRPANKGEMITGQNLNTKAFHELLLYYFQERERAKNSDIRHCVVTNVYEWFIFDAALIDRLFYRNAHLTKEYKAWATGQKVSKNNDLFYNEIAKPFLAALDEEIPFTYFNLLDYKAVVTDADDANDKLLLPLYKVLSPTHLLKLPTATDSNRLNPKFYSELLHLIGLEEVKEGGKKVIRRKEVGKRDEGSLLENAIIELDSSGKFYQLHDRSHYGATTDDQLFTVGLELCITWINRILFLKLLESQLVKYHQATNGNGNKEYTFLNRETIPDFDELNKLFFRVLARKPSERQASILIKFGRVPYLNSSLFEPTELEQDSIGINQLDNGLTLPVLRNSVLSDNPAYQHSKDLNTLSYLFAFLDAYDFASESRETIQEKNRTLINASVLGLIFEKINGYKDGSFYTPGFITEYMCRETIRKAVVQKFNDAKGWDCADFAALENKDLNRIEANNLINEIRICDPAVGSGHFLVSALNELIAVKSDLGVLQDENGKRLKEYTVSIVNDELVIQDEDETPFQYVLQATGKPTAERQRVQKTLFHEKQTIIENCLFGVDINPNSVKICRLRLWIELLKNAYYTDESGFTELETLPNIDINIKQGNSLLSKFSLTEDLSDVFKKQKFTLQSYKNAVAAYKNAPNKEAKAELQRFINEIKSQFRETVSNRDPKRRKLADLRGQRVLLDNNIDIFGNPIKDPKLVAAEIIRTDKYIEQIETEITNIENNALYRGSFEWRFEFPEVLNDKGDFVGFDAIIGNPPYGIREKGKSYLAFVEQFYPPAKKVADSYFLFTVLCKRIVKSQGIFSFIVPNTFCDLEQGQDFRRWFLTENKVLQLYDSGWVFEDAVVDTAVFFAQNIKSDSDTIRLASRNMALSNLSLTAIMSNKGLKIDYRTDQRLKTLLSKIVNTSKYVSDFASVKAGVKLYEKGKGNPAQTEQTMREKPYTVIGSQPTGWRLLVRGGDVNRYTLHNSGEYVRYGEWLAAPRTASFFEGKRILIRRTDDVLRATFTQNDSVCVNSCHVLKTHNEELTHYILALLNSRLLQWVFAQQNPQMIGKAFAEIKLTYVENLPVKEINTNTMFEDLTTQILTTKAANPTADTSALEAEIDRLVYALYGLTDEEIAIVEGQ